MVPEIEANCLKIARELSHLVRLLCCMFGLLPLGLLHTSYLQIHLPPGRARALGKGGGREVYTG